jgi:hypothetical protein
MLVESDRLLPRFELDPAAVLPAGAVLREETRPVLRVRHDVDAPGPRHLIYFVREYGRYRFRTLEGDARYRLQHVMCSRYTLRG